MSWTADEHTPVTATITDASRNLNGTVKAPVTYDWEGSSRRAWVTGTYTAGDKVTVYVAPDGHSVAHLGVRSFSLLALGGLAIGMILGFFRCLSIDMNGNVQISRYIRKRRELIYVAS